VIRDGMVPKVEAALGALGAGVGEVRITDLAGLAAGRGTALVA
jgi:acetylglutamate kinase